MSQNNHQMGNCQHRGGSAVARMSVSISYTESSLSAITRHCIVRSPRRCLVGPYDKGGADTTKRPLVYNPGRVATSVTVAQTGFLSIPSLLGGH